MNLFSVGPGAAVAVFDPQSLPMTIWLQDWEGYALRNCILQSVGMQNQANCQFLTTLRNYVYVYVFGDSPGDIQIRGKAFAAQCETGWRNGLDYAMAYYANRTVSWTGRSLLIQIGAAIFIAFLVKGEFGANDPVNNISDFTLHFKTVPT